MPIRTLASAGRSQQLGLLTLLRRVGKKMALMAVISNTPRQPWITATTWATVRRLAPLRRLASTVRPVAHRAHLRAELCAWAGQVHQEFDPLQPGMAGRLGWRAACALSEARRRAFKLRLISSALWAAAARLQQKIKPSVKADRIAFTQGKVAEAQAACAETRAVRMP
ncbi:unnamed protein product [Prorocentrum cordatum]|uniref:Uncharacterized protein n=1 Tax=Prorocentrum cordatum TaxID=2364126 RepID=A0ABN9X1T2_9DINO|nr:unnamed protein product [Polarella glacialis]